MIPVHCGECGPYDPVRVIGYSTIDGDRLLDHYKKQHKFPYGLWDASQLKKSTNIPIPCNDKFVTGKYAGKTFQYVFESDPSFINFLVKNDAGSSSFKKFIKIKDKILLDNLK